MSKSKKVVVLIVLTITVIISGLFSAYRMANRKAVDFKQTYALILDSIYEAIENELGKPIYSSLSMSGDVLLEDLVLAEADMDEDAYIKEVTRYLSAMKEETGAQTAFLISDSSKKYYTYAGLNKVVKPDTDEHDVWYSIFVNTRKPYDLDVDVDQVNGNQWTVFVNARIEDENGKLLGVCGLGMSMDRIQEVLQHYEETYGVKINFINSDGVVQIDTDSVNIENSYLHDVQYGKEKDGYSYENRDGEYVVMRFVDNLNWYLVIHGDIMDISFRDVSLILFPGLALIVINAVVIILMTRKEKEN